MIDKPDFVEMSGDLPSGWEERTSRSTGQTYFLNQVDNHLHFLAIATLDSATEAPGQATDTHR